uniref:BTB domain-containing protein n=1 Tax=Panagrolaimus davidi TaxID=227884 RepID=A0A914QED3_9BILA
MVDEMRQILIDRFEKQDTKTGFYDVTFTIQNKLLHAHRFLFSTNSEPFQAMFSKTWTSNNEPIEIKTCTFETFKTFISYFYHGKCNFDETMIFDIIDLAEMYQIQPLKNQFDTFLSETSFTDANIYKLLETLEIYKFEKLKNSLGNYLVGNWRTLFERDDFLKANKNVSNFAKKFNGRYHQVLRGFIYAESEDPVNELIEHIQTFQNDNGAYYMNPSWDRWIPHLKFQDDLEYLDDEQTQYSLRVDCGSQIVIINTKIFEHNQIYMDAYKPLCYLESKNFPTFEKEETDFYIQIL